MSRVYLVGFMGVGKSTLGRQLATKLGYEFLDLDKAFEAKYKVSINDFFKKYGEELFRKLENEVLVSTFSMEKVVISTGGGTVCHFNAIQQMNNNGTTIYLEMTEAAIVNRLQNAKRKRPLVVNKSESELLDIVKVKLKERVPFYQQASYNVNAMHITIDELAKIIH